MDRALYLPKSWTQYRERCRYAGIPDDIEFASKLELARRMLERAPDQEVPAAWVTGDSIYGDNRSLRLWLEERAQPFVLEVACNEPLWWKSFRYTRTDEIASALPDDEWQTLSAGSSTQGRALVRLDPGSPDEAAAHGGGASLGPLPPDPAQSLATG